MSEIDEDLDDDGSITIDDYNQKMTISEEENEESESDGDDD